MSSEYAATRHAPAMNSASPQPVNSDTSSKSRSTISSFAKAPPDRCAPQRGRSYRHRQLRYARRAARRSSTNSQAVSSASMLRPWRASTAEMSRVDAGTIVASEARAALWTRLPAGARISHDGQLEPFRTSCSGRARKRASAAAASHFEAHDAGELPASRMGGSPSSSRRGRRRRPTPHSPRRDDQGRPG